MMAIYEDLNITAREILESFGAESGTLIVTNYEPVDAADPGGEVQASVTTRDCTVLSVKMDQVRVSRDDADTTIYAQVEHLMIVCDLDVDVRDYDTVTFGGRTLNLKMVERTGTPDKAVIWRAQGHPS